MKSINEKGMKMSSEWFIGNVYANMLIEKSDDLNAIIGQVSFEAKARTNWHKHSTGQILIVTDGVGYYQERGKPIQIINKGDVVKIPKDTEHWHGASNESFMEHIAIVPDRNVEITEWLNPVTDEEYNLVK